MEDLINIEMVHWMTLVKNWGKIGTDYKDPDNCQHYW